jgi:PAS domain S-box-containing protein
MESANDGIITADSDGIILSWNNASKKIFGYAESDAIGKNLTLIISNQYREAHEKGMARVADGGSHHVIGNTVELFGLHKKGHLFPIELSLSTWQTGNQRLFCGIIRDISERKKQEEKILIQQDELQSKTEELTKLNEEVSTKNEQLQALSNKLAKYLSRQVYTSIFEGKRDVKIESYRKKLTIFFSDIQGFTELTEKVESEVLTSVLNKYLNEMSKIALDHGGTIDKYIGDAIMIFFGDPETLGEKQDEMACIKMAIAMKEKLVELRREWEILGISTPLRVRMGINTGYCTVGNFGSKDRLDYTIVSGPVNVAARLESAAPIDDILISSDTYALVKEETVCENFGEIQAKRIAYPIQTYLVKNLASNLKKEEEELIAQLKGFNLSINFHELGYADKLYARELLEKAIKKL